jgi:hypothetical protein
MVHGNKDGCYFGEGLKHSLFFADPNFNNRSFTGIFH